MSKFETPEVSELLAALKDAPKDKIIIMDCEVCEKKRYPGEKCDHAKNGYCAQYRFQAALDHMQYCQGKTA